MKRAFTLIEMMVVIAVLVTLMAMTFRLGRIASESEERSTTIARMQRLENALSGFHAAFGCYPPVKLHGNRSFSQQRESIDWSGDGSAAWRLVERICRTQPMGCRFPFSSKMADGIRELSDLVKEAASSGEFDDVFSDETTKEWASQGFYSSSDSAVEGRLNRSIRKRLRNEKMFFCMIQVRYMYIRGKGTNYL